MVAQKGRMQLLKDVGKEAGMFLLLSDEQFDGVRVCVITGLTGESASTGFQARAIGAFAQLKPGEGTGQRGAQARVERNSFMPGDAAAVELVLTEISEPVGRVHAVIPIYFAAQSMCLKKVMPG